MQARSSPETPAGLLAPCPPQLPWTEEGCTLYPGLSSPLGRWHPCVVASLRWAPTAWSGHDTWSRRPMTAQVTPCGRGGWGLPWGAGPRCTHHHSITPGHRCGNLPGGLAEEPKRDGKRAGRPSGDSQAWANRREAPLMVRGIQKPHDSVNRHLPVQTPGERGHKLEEGLDRPPKGPVVFQRSQTVPTHLSATRRACGVRRGSRYRREGFLEG